MCCLRALTIVIFSNLPCTKYEFLHDGANKTMTCYTFSVRKIIPESKNLKTAMKNINEKENKNRKDATKNFPTIRIENELFSEKKLRNKGCYHTALKRTNM